MPPRGRTRWPRRLAWSALALVAAAAGGLAWYRQASLPAHEGERSVPGLAAPVSIVRDAHAVPDIRAETEADALFALGYVHAQDRLWQIDFNRRIAQGRVAEILGPAAVDTDRFLRTLGVHRVAQSIVANLDAETRALLDAYAAGVNAYLATRTEALPPEFFLLRAPAPEPWTAADSVAWSLMMAWDLSRTYLNELARLRLATRLTRAEIDEFRPPYPGDAPPAVADYVELYRVLGLARGGATAVIEQAARLAAAHPVAGFGEGEGIGSNNWVVAGSRTASGKPLLANDPHLGLTVPSVWYFARLRAPGLDVFGATLPGVPYVVLGRNTRVAWGFTNTGSDVQDLYLERINPADPDEYQTPDGYARFATRTEVIRVRGAEDVRLVVRATRHGPVISGALAAVDRALPRGEARYVLALRWAALEPADATMRALRAMNRARDAREFERALRDWQLVQQNIVFADVEGRIGMIAPGRIPVRRPDNDLMGLAPSPGWEARYDWDGWLPYEALPRVIDPPAGYIVTANHKITPPGYAAYLTFEWFLPYRARRIGELIESRPKHTPRSFRRIQADVVSLAARDLLAAMAKVEPQSAAARIALERLRAWDGSMGVDAPEPVLLHAWLRRLRSRIFDDDLGALAQDFVASSELVQVTLDVLAGRTRARDWCDDVATARRETCDELAAEALEEAIRELAHDGRDLLALRWGDFHQAVLEHRPLSNVPVVRDWVELAAPVPGDSYTINVGQLLLRGDRPFSTRHAASLRAIFDLSNAGDAWIFATGQLGHPLSPQYGALLPAWRDAEQLPLQWTATGGNERGARLVLTPRGD
ncbi:MAG: penicillin acylase family protein [Burkholderiaceae bacterium]